MKSTTTTTSTLLELISNQYTADIESTISLATITEFVNKKLNTVINPKIVSKECKKLFKEYSPQIIGHPEYRKLHFRCTIKNPVKFVIKKLKIYYKEEVMENPYLYCKAEEGKKLIFVKECEKLVLVGITENQNQNYFRNEITEDDKKSFDNSILKLYKKIDSDKNGIVFFYIKPEEIKEIKEIKEEYEESPKKLNYKDEVKLIKDRETGKTVEIVSQKYLNYSDDNFAKMLAESIEQDKIKTRNKLIREINRRELILYDGFGDLTNEELKQILIDNPEE